MSMLTKLAMKKRGEERVIIARRGGGGGVRGCLAKALFSNLHFHMMKGYSEKRRL